MARRIGFAEVDPSAGAIGWSGGSSAALLENATVLLHFRLTTTDDASIEAIRYARRAMLREEWTRGALEDDPSLEDAVFSSFEVTWEVPVEHRERCRKKLEELVERANRALAEGAAARRT